MLPQLLQAPRSPAQGLLDAGQRRPARPSHQVAVSAARLAFLNCRSTGADVSSRSPSATVAGCEIGRQYAACANSKHIVVTGAFVRTTPRREGKEHLRHTALANRGSGKATLPVTLQERAPRSSKFSVTVAPKTVAQRSGCSIAPTGPKSSTRGITPRPSGPRPPARSTKDAFCPLHNRRQTQRQSLCTSQTPASQPLLRTFGNWQGRSYPDAHCAQLDHPSDPRPNPTSVAD